MSAVALLRILAMGATLPENGAYLGYDFDVVSTPREVLDMLKGNPYELIILHQNAVDGDLSEFINRIKRRYPLVPVLVQASTDDVDQKLMIIESNADDVLPPAPTEDDLLLRIHLALKQREEQRTLARRNDLLNRVSMLVQRIYSLDNAESFYRDALDILCNALPILGAAIVVEVDNYLTRYTCRSGKDPDRFDTEAINPPDYDPFMRVAESRMIEVHQNIGRDRHFLAPPVLRDAHSALVIPMIYGEQMLGVLGIFGTLKDPVDYDDIAMYELLASHLSIALDNTRQQLQYKRHARFNNFALQAWENFISAQTTEDLAAILNEIVLDAPQVQGALVYLYSDTMPMTVDATTDAIIYTDNASTESVFRHLLTNHALDETINAIQQSRENYIIRRTSRDDDPAQLLFEGMGGQYITFFPIFNSAWMLGMIVVSYFADTERMSDTFEIVWNLGHKAAIAVERQTLISMLQEKNSRLEAILRSVSEGVFFINADDTVVFCNPQFAEMTGIDAFMVLNQKSDVLFQQLAHLSAKPEATLADLHQMASTLGADADYPIFELHMLQENRVLNVEMVLIEQIDEHHMRWAGVIRENQGNEAIEASNVDLSLEQVIAPHDKLQRMINSLSGKHVTLSTGQRNVVMREIEQQVNRVGRALDNLTSWRQYYNGEVELDHEPVMPDTLLRFVFDDPYYRRLHSACKIQVQGTLESVEVNLLAMRRAIGNVLYYAVEIRDVMESVLVTLRQQSGSLQLEVVSPTANLSQAELDYLFNFDQPLAQNLSDPNADGIFGVYLSREIVRQHGGQLRIAGGSSLTITILLPNIVSSTSVPTPTRSVPAFLPEDAEMLTDAETAEMDLQVDIDLPANVPQTGPLIDPENPQDVVIFQGNSRLTQTLIGLLKQESYDLTIMQDVSRGIKQVGMTGADLLVVDMGIPNSIELCRQLRDRSRTPILMLSDELNENERHIITDIEPAEYVWLPVSPNELLHYFTRVLNSARRMEQFRKPRRYDELYIDFARRKVTLSGKPVKLTRIEYELLQTLIAHEGKYLSHEYLLVQVWGPGTREETQYLWVNMSRLRKKIEPDGKRYIHNRRRVGYKFEVEE